MAKAYLMIDVEVGEEKKVKEEIENEEQVVRLEPLDVE